MSYEPSHRKAPRQERWPYATPQEAWPAYLGGDDYRAGDQARELQGADRRGWATAGYHGQPGYRPSFGGSEDPGYPGYPPAEGTDAFAGPGNGYGAGGSYPDARGGYAGTASGYDDAGQGNTWAGNGYQDPAGGYADALDGYADGRVGYAGATDGYWDAADGFDGSANGYGSTANGYGSTANGYGSTANGYGSTANGYGSTANGYGGHDGYAEAREPFPGSVGSAGYADQLDQDEYTEPRPSSPLLIAPDAVAEWGWLSDESEEPGWEPDRTGLIVGAVTGFLAAAVAIGVATLAAAFVRPQASPVIAVGGAFVDRTPAALKNFAVEHFGENDKTILLLGMYVLIACIAMAIGCLARRNVAIGVAGLAAFGLFGAFVAITRPESHVADVIPSVIGVIAGIAALLWLDRASAPVAPLRHAHGGGRRRAR